MPAGPQHPIAVLGAGRPISAATSGRPAVAVSCSITCPLCTNGSTRRANGGSPRVTRCSVKSGRPIRRSNAAADRNGVMPMPPATKMTRETAASRTNPPRGSETAVPDVTIQVSREESALRATRAGGALIFFAPVSSGSEHDPLPPGDWKVTSIDWHPQFHYNPELFWDANPQHAKATIKPGPNNPVGIVWIDLNLEHYGLHGTPEPSRIGCTQSHGCVRLTNWDAARVASIVQPGTPVLFR